MGQDIKIVGKLAAGGFGAVLLAHRYGARGFRKEVAIKILHAVDDDQGDAARKQRIEVERRLRDEAVMLGMLDHPNIVGANDLLALDGQPAVEMEFIRGVDLATLSRTEPLPLRTALQVVAGVARALSYAFEHRKEDGTRLKIVHRDIKPANIVISVHGQVKVLDFGIARGDFDRQGETRSMQFGTASYMPPEAYLSDQLLGSTADVFALGVTLARIASGVGVARWVAGDRHFKTQHEEWIEHIEAKLPDDPVTPQVVRLIHAMTRFNPRARLSTQQVERHALGLVAEAGGADIRDYARMVVAPAFEVRRAGLEPWSDDAQPTIARLVGEPTLDTPAEPATPAPAELAPPAPPRPSLPAPGGANTPKSRPSVRGAMLVATLVAVVTVALGGLALYPYFTGHTASPEPAAGPNDVIASTVSKKPSPPAEARTVPRQDSPREAESASERHASEAGATGVTQPPRPERKSPTPVRDDAAAAPVPQGSPAPESVQATDRDTTPEVASSEATELPGRPSVDETRGTPGGTARARTVRPVAEAPVTLIFSCGRPAKVWIDDVGPRRVTARFELGTGYKSARVVIQDGGAAHEITPWVGLKEPGTAHYHCARSEDGTWALDLREE